MPSLTASYDPEHGPVVEVLVSLPGDTQLSRIEFMSIRLLLDTGATTSAIAPEVLKNLGLTPKGLTTVFLAGGSKDMNRYLIDLSIPFREEQVHRRYVEVIEFLGPSDFYQGLLGRDILDQGTFHLLGKEKRFYLSLDDNLLAQ